MTVDRAALADFLRRRRAVLQPEDVGLARGTRRRTEGLRREEVAALSHMSADYYARLERGQGPVRWRERGLEALERHLGHGHRVVVVTGAPALLARALLEARGLGQRVAVLGTLLRSSARGWTVYRHCHGAEKCRFLAEAGYGDSWSYAYSDSAEDTPLLARASQPFLVNGRPRVVAALQRQRLPRLQPLSW